MGGEIGILISNVSNLQKIVLSFKRRGLKKKKGAMLTGKQLLRGTFPHGISREVQSLHSNSLSDQFTLPVAPLYNLRLFKHKRDCIKTLQQATNEFDK